MIQIRKMINVVTLKGLGGMITDVTATVDPILITQHSGGDRQSIHARRSDEQLDIQKLFLYQF